MRAEDLGDYIRRKAEERTKREEPIVTHDLAALWEAENSTRIIEKLRITQGTTIFAWHAPNDYAKILGKLPKAFRAREGARRIKEGLQNLVLPGLLFEEMGFKYFGPIDGHDYDVLEETLSDLKRFDEPVFLHVLTRKGRGYAPAESDSTSFHGVGVFDPDTGVSRPVVDASGHRFSNVLFGINSETTHQFMSERSGSSDDGSG